MSALVKAMVRSRTVVSQAQQYAMILKKSGKISSILDMGPSTGLGQLSAFQDQGANRQRYARFRGWVHAAINALAIEAAGQPFHVGKMAGADTGKKPKGKKEVIILDGHGRSAHIAHKHERNKMPDWLVSKAAKTELEIFQDHPAIDFMKKPNPIQYDWQFVYSFVANLCLTGWGFVVGGVNEETGEVEMYSLPTTWIQPDHSKGAFAEFRIVNPNNPSQGLEGPPLTRDNVAFAYIPNPADPLSALAPSQAQGMAIKVDDAIQSTQAVFFDNAVFPSAIVTVGKLPHPDVQGGVRPTLTAAQRRQVYGAIRKVSAGIANYGNPAIVDGLIESIERLSATQNEIGWEKSEKSVRTRILSAFGVHPFILGEEMAGSYAQAYVVQDRFCSRVNVFLGLLSTIMTDFAPSLFSKSKKDTEKLLFWWEKCKAKDPSMEKALWEGARTRNDITQNEFRAFMDLPPDEDKNESQIDKAAVVAISGIAEKVKAGAIARDQAIAILEGLGLPTKMAEDIAGEEPEEAPQQPGMPAPGMPPQGGLPQQDNQNNGDVFGGDDETPAPSGDMFSDEEDQFQQAAKSLLETEAVIRKSRMLIGVV